MTAVSFDISEEALQTVGKTPGEFADAVRLAAAMFWYGRSDVTMGTAAEIAGLDLRDFLTALSKHRQDIFVFDLDDLDQELAFLSAPNEVRCRA